MRSRTAWMALLMLWLLRAFATWGMFALGMMAVGADRFTAFVGAMIWLLIVAPFVLKRRKRVRKSDDTQA